MANNEANDTSTQNSKFVNLNSSQQQMNELLNIQLPQLQFKQKMLKAIYSKVTLYHYQDPIRRKYVGCKIYVNDLEKYPNYKSAKNQQCRICMSEEETSRLISPCKCKGTSEFVHEECLKMWILEQQGVSRIFNDDIICEICNQKLEYDVDFVDRFDINQYRRVKKRTKICWLIQIIFIFLFIFASVQIGIQFGMTQLATVAIIVIFALITIALIVYLIMNILQSHQVQMIENWTFQNFKSKPLQRKKFLAKQQKLSSQFIRINQISIS